MFHHVNYNVGMALSIYENLTYGLEEADYTEDTVIDAAKKACAHDFIESFPIAVCLRFGKSARRPVSFTDDDHHFASESQVEVDAPLQAAFHYCCTVGYSERGNCGAHLLAWDTGCLCARY